MAHERAPLLVPGVRPCVAPKYSQASGSAREVLGAAVLGAIGVPVHHVTVAHAAQAVGVS